VTTRLTNRDSIAPESRARVKPRRDDARWVLHTRVSYPSRISISRIAYCLPIRDRPRSRIRLRATSRGYALCVERLLPYHRLHMPI
jgi:hypothetical protein